LGSLKSTFLQKRVYGIEKWQEDLSGIIALIFFSAVLKHIFFFILLFLARYKVYIVNPSGNIFVKSG